MIRKYSDKAKMRIRKRVLLWILLPLVVFNQACCVEPVTATVTVTVGLVQALQVLAYTCYGLAYKNALDINQHITNMPQLNTQAVSQVQNGSSSVYTFHNPVVQQSQQTQVQQYRPILTTERLQVFQAQMFGQNSLAQQTISVAPTPTPPSIFKSPTVTAGYRLYENVVNQQSMWDKVSVQCSAGGQRFQMGSVCQRLENIKAVTSGADAFLAQAQHMDFLESKLNAVMHSPVVHGYMHAAQGLLRDVIVQGVDVSHASNFTTGITSLYDSITATMHQVSGPEAAALGEIRQALKCVIGNAYAKNYDFRGITTPAQIQVVVDAYARMLGGLTQGGFEQTLNATIAQGADYLIPSRDFYFPKGFSKLFFVPFNSCREAFSVRYVNAAVAWSHGADVTDKVRGNVLNQTMYNVQSLVKHGFLDQASRLVENFNPAFNTDRRHDYAHCYSVLKETFNACKTATLNEFGVPKIFEIHPQWPALKDILTTNPTCLKDVLWKLEHEQAFAFNLLHDLGITDPSENQMKMIYGLCDYSDLHCFNEAVAGIKSFCDVPKILDNFAHHRIEYNAVRSSLLGLGFAAKQFEQYMPSLVQFAHDPQFLPLLQVLKEQSGSIGDFLKVMTEREKASIALLERCGIIQPSATTKQMSYNLIDVMHDKSQVIELLSCLDPQHADPLIRGTYHDFFDAQGIQKLLPINDQVRALLYDRFGQAINLNQDPEMRFICNRLAIFNANTPEQFDVIRRGLNYIEQGFIGGSHKAFMREYAGQYVQALTHPNEENLRVLSMSDLVDGFLRSMPEELRVTFGNLLTQVLNPSPQATLQPSMLQGIRNALTYIQANDYISAQNVLNSVIPLGVTGPVLPNNTQGPVPLQNHDLNPKKIVQNSSLSTTIPQTDRYNVSTPSGASSASFSFQQPLYGAQVAAHRFLKEYIFQVANGEAQNRLELARWLLADGQIIATTHDGFVIGFNDECYAYVRGDGTVDMMYPQPGDAQDFAERLRCLSRTISKKGVTRCSVLNVARTFHVDVQSHIPGNAGGSEVPSGGCGTGTYGAGSSTDTIPPRCGTSEVDTRAEPYSGAKNPITERLEQAREARRKAELETLNRVRPGVNPKKFTRCGASLRRTLSDSDLKQKRPISNLVRTFGAQDDSQASSSSQPPPGLEVERVIGSGEYGKLVIGPDGVIKFIPPEGKSFSGYRNPEDLFEECFKKDKTGGKSRIFDKDGDFEEALRDCLSIGGKITKPIKGGVAVAFPDGRTGSVRKLSTYNGPDGLAPTLDIANPDGSTIKIRYRR